MIDNYQKLIDSIVEQRRKENMSEHTTVQHRGASALTVIGIIFVILKLVGVQPIASWSWLWVLCPFWIGLAIGVCVVLMIIVLAVVAAGTR